MSLKKYLKASKTAIDNRNGYEALECANEVLSLDPKHYFGHLFKARAYQLLGNQDDAEKTFEEAIEIEPENILGWRGYFQAVKAGSDHKKFFQVLSDCAQILANQNEPLDQIPKDIYAYLHKHNFKSDSELNEIYLRSILPDAPLGAVLEGRLGSTLENIRKLLQLVKAKEDKEVTTRILKEKLKYPASLTLEMQKSLNAIEWETRQKSNLTRLYLLFLSYCDDDTVRRQYEVDFLRYKYALLRISPVKDVLFAEVKEMAADLVLLDCSDPFPWSLHLDLSDYESLANIDPLILQKFLIKFKSDPLGLVLYLFVFSENCPLDKKYFEDIHQRRAKNDDGDEDLPIEAFEGSPTLSTAATTLQPSSDLLSSMEVRDLMTKGFKSCSNSILAHRILAHSYNFYGEYASNLKICADGIRRLASKQNQMGVDLQNSREDLTCHLALVYTYHEAPKNFGRALQIFDKILKTNPSNERALIGKGLILVEKGEYASAEKFLKDVTQKFPYNAQALNELGWCLILQHNYQDGRAYLQQAMSKVTGTSLRDFDTRANISWRIATSLIEEYPDEDSNIKAAYDLIVSSLKNSKSHAPSYTLLGVILQDFYGDNLRAQKCFYKAFELDAAEVTAARYLVTDLCSKGDWDVSEILCERVVESTNSRKALFSSLNKNQDKSWPYRVLGCSALNKQNDAKAIEWFQTALRMQAMDIECWTGLGEAYFNCGRMDAAIKVFQHTIELDDCTWVNFYMLGQAVCLIGDYPSGLDLLQKALLMSPTADCILSAIYEQNILYCSQLLQGGFVGRTLETNKTAIKTISLAVEKHRDSFSLWKALGDCISVVCEIQRQIETAPFDTIFSILKHAEGIDDDCSSLLKAQELLKEESYVNCIAMLGTLAGKAALSKVTKRENKLVRSCVLFNLGLAYINAFNVSLEKKEKYRNEAVRVIKDAIKIEPQNAQYWISLGVAYVSLNPSLLQHCFIKASVLDSRDVSPWSNLAALYLRYGDVELAAQVFDRASSVAPELSTPWLGKALTSYVTGDIEDYSRLTTHAQVLSNGTSPLAQLCYAISVVNNRIEKHSDAKEVASVQEISVANAAIRRYLQFQPDNIVGLKLAFLLSERCHTYEMSIEIGQILFEALEKDYEKTESALVLLDLGIIKTQLARVLMGNGNFEAAVENSQFTLDLFSEEQPSDEVTKAMLSSRIVIGLSFFFNKQFEEALEEFQIILDGHSQSHRAITLVAQVLYAIDSPESKQAAVDHLFTFIEENGSSLLVVLILGVISLSDNYSSYFEAIKEELEGLPLKDLVEDSRNAVPKLLKELNDAIGKKNSRVWQKFALLFPGDFRVWSQLNSQMALSSSLLSEAKATAPEVSSAYVEKKSRREVQRALLIYADNRLAREIIAES